MTIKTVLIGRAAMLIGLFGPLPFASADEQVTHWVSDHMETWRIDEPNVGQNETSYPNIPFQDRDHKTIQAGDCVQTGGV